MKAKRVWIAWNPDDPNNSVMQTEEPQEDEWFSITFDYHDDIRVPYKEYILIEVEDDGD